MEWTLVFFHTTDLLPKACTKYVKLESPNCNYVVEANRCPTVRLQEDHQESKADEYHYVHILILGVVIGQQGCDRIIVCGV